MLFSSLKSKDSSNNIFRAPACSFDHAKSEGDV